MKLRLLHTLLLLTTSLLSFPGLAQTAYRCGDSYSQAPCPGGAAMDVNDSRTLAQKTQADAATQRDAKQAQTMEKSRLKQEAEARKADATAHKAGAKQASKSKAHAKKQGNKPAYFTARELDGKKVGKKKTGGASGGTTEDTPPTSKP